MNKKPESKINNNWTNFLNAVNAEIRNLEDKTCDTPYFRGHSHDTYQLLPTILRNKKTDVDFTETALFYEFTSMAGSKIKGYDTWEILFTMRHYGLPTRLLDWTTSFANALYFALAGNKLHKPHIWIMNPYELSEKNVGFLPSGLLNPNYDLEHDYVKLFINKRQFPNIKRPEYPIPLYPARNDPRMYAQQGVFTFHGTRHEPLEELIPKSLKKIYIPDNCIKEAKDFLTLAGVNEYLMFPDFTGLANYLKTRHNF